MAVYVDNMKASYGRMKMCHMMADTTDELLEMADRIGVKRRWIQYAGTVREHFDISMTKRAEAVKAGAIEVTMRDLGILMKRKREQDSNTLQENPMERQMKPIPISAAKKIADEYGYDQVVILARRVGDDPDPHGENVTTYGVNPAHCEVAARIGTTLKHHLMGWPSTLFESGLRFIGIGRDAIHPKALSISVSRETTDDELRAIHDFLSPTS